MWIGADRLDGAITGKPSKPTTQGENERFHQTLFRYLDKQPIAESLAGLQAQVDAFDHIHNSERPLPRAARAGHSAGSVGSEPQSRSTPPATWPAGLRRTRPESIPVPPSAATHRLPADTHVRTVTMP